MPAAQWLGMVVVTQEESTEAVDPSKQERGLQGISECQSARELHDDDEKKSLNWRSQITLDVTPDPPPILYVTSLWVSPVSLLTISFFALK